MIRHTVRALLLTAALLLGLAVPAGAAVVSSGASTSHPYSNPTWFPLRGVVSVMGCATGNCPVGHGSHPDYAMDLLSHSKAGAPDYHPQKIYAAGSGIVHIGRNVGNRCENPSSLGTWIWIDHGGGVVSRYGHLSRISISNGQYVTPMTPLGYTGHSGENTTGDCNKVTNYLNFSIRHNGIYGNPVAPPSLKVCVATKAVWWPAGVGRGYASWQKVPNGTTLDNSAGAGSKCVTNTALKTPSAPRLSSAAGGSGRVRGTWAAPSSGYHVTYVQVELRLYHPSNGGWTTEGRHNVNVTTSHPTSYTFSGLLHKRNYAVRASFYNTYGWSKPSGYRYVKTT
jgi:hypothetical protein